MISQLKDLGVEILDDKPSLYSYSFDNSAYQKIPFAVAKPNNHQQVQKIIQFCYSNCIKIIPRAAATATTGAAVPNDSDTLIISTEKLNQVIGINLANQSIKVQPGVTNLEVQQHANHHNLFWPPDPSSMNVCTVGGNLATNASGPRAFFYGSTRENVLSIKAIDGRGCEFTSGFECSKYSVGYDLTRLIIGSEGTLAFITEATLKLRNIPSQVTLFQLFFKSTLDAVNAIIGLRNSKFMIQSIEFLDDKCLELIKTKTQIPNDAKSMIILEVIDLNNEHKAMLLQQIRCSDYLVADDENIEKRIKQSRKLLSPAIKQYAPNRKNEDVVVPIDKLNELFDLTGKIEKKYDLSVINFGHAGNGNLHVNIMYDEKNESQKHKAVEAMNDLMYGVIDLGGAISGEHGIGLAKSQFMKDAVHSNSLDLMKKIKSQFDPKNILNPNKLW